MTALIQITIDDKDLQREGIDAQEIVDKTIDVIANYYAEYHRFYFDVGYNPQQIVIGGRS